ncbi:MAG: TGS domain-containing protein [Candidatus Bathyarchaeota archaeon]|jgi:ribosome-interacting GTPase 1|nr:TGS domain-containing protein [Candidatus Bathyarchaeota archaeon A05DMB-5]MDH7558067.1 TGS domain-containing protein [Candidatus Bathyarchaeota archaeon]
MPTNLPPDAKKKWAEVEATKNPRERLLRMQEFLSLVPKHKGTLKLRGQIKKQIAVMRKEMEEKKRKRAGKGGPKYFIEKEGAAQIVLLGVTNVGRSSLLGAVTNSKVEVSWAPYTTREPVPGIMNFEDIQFQLLEAPALIEGSAEGRAWGLQTLALARNADGLVLMVDLSQNSVEQLSLILDELEKARILVSKPKAKVEVERKFMGAGLRIIVFGRLVDCSFRDVEDLLKSYRIGDAVVKISGEATLDEVEDAIFENTVYKPAVVVANKIDLAGAEGNFKLLRAYVGEKLPILAVSCTSGYGLDKLGETLFKTLDIIRVYTKEPNMKDYSKKPFVLKKGATVYDLAKNIHSDFKENFYFAKIWAKRFTFSPQKVGASFVLEDGDVVEIHLK